MTGFLPNKWKRGTEGTETNGSQNTDLTDYTEEHGWPPARDAAPAATGRRPQRGGRPLNCRREAQRATSGRG
jgi:hypothetical protein